MQSTSFSHHHYSSESHNSAKKVNSRFHLSNLVVVSLQVVLVLGVVGQICVAALLKNYFASNFHRKSLPVLIRRLGQLFKTFYCRQLAHGHCTNYVVQLSAPINIIESKIVYSAQKYFISGFCAL